MPLEPQKESQEMLKAWSQKRRDAAGPRFEPHPATRQLLLSEMRRFHGQAQVGPEAPGTFRELWSLLYPRLAVAFATVALAGLAIWLVSPQLAQNSTMKFASRTDRSETIPSPRPAIVSAPSANRTDAKDETANKKEAPVFMDRTRSPSLSETQATVGTRFMAAKSVAEAKETLVEKKNPQPGAPAVAREEAQSRLGAVPVPAAAPAAAMTRAPAGTAGVVVLASNEPGTPAPKPADGSLNHGLEMKADKAPALSTPTDALLKTPSLARKSEIASAAAPSLDVQLKLRDQTEAMADAPARMGGVSAAQKQITQSIQNRANMTNVTNGSIQPIAVAVQRFIQISPSLSTFRNQVNQNGSANQSLDNGNTSNAANTFNGARNQASQGVLQSFDLEQNANRIVIVDGDGSVYSGEWISADMDLGRTNGQMNQALDNFANDDRRQGRGGLGGQGGNGNGAAQQYAPPRLQVYFHAQGINQTLRQAVAVRGFLELATTAPVVQNSQAPGAQALNITRVQAQVSTSTNAPTEIYAVPVKP